MKRDEILKSLGYQAAKEAVKRYQTNQELDIDSFEDGAVFGHDYALKRLRDWIRTNYEDIGIGWMRGYSADDLVEWILEDIGPIREDVQSDEEGREDEGLSEV